jgi:hypothetical protein
MELFGQIPAAALEQDHSVIFGLDESLRLTYCNTAWDRFAAANGGLELIRPAPIGQPLLGYISGPLAAYYEMAFHDVLRDAQPWHHVYECSSPAAFRKFVMHVFPVKQTHGLLVVNSLCVERPHEPSHTQRRDPDYRGTNGILVMCSHCRRTRRSAASEQWDWVPEYVEHQPPKTSHGLCNPCLEFYYPK